MMKQFFARAHQGRRSSCCWLLVFGLTLFFGGLRPSFGQASPQGGPPRDESGIPDFFKLTPLPPDAPKPALDPKNLEGTWYHHELLERAIAKTMYGKPVPMTSAARQILDRRTAAEKAGTPIANPSSYCRPPGQTWQLDLNFPFTVLQTKNEIYFVFEEFHGVWKIRMNQPHRTSNAREYMGDSVGRWDGDTLVVDTVNYKNAFWIDIAGLSTSREVHMVHRVRKINAEDGPALEIVTTIDDPAMFNAQWSMVRTFVWRPDKSIFAEYNCEQQMGAPDAIAAYGLVEE